MTKQEGIELTTTPTEIRVEGIGGLSVFLGMIQSAWADGKEIILENKTRFIPKGKESIHCEVLPLIGGKE